MVILITVCGFAGAWLLFAGPMYQAALELTSLDIDRDSVESLQHDLPAGRRVSPWWWLLPPVAYVLHRRQSRRYRAEVMARLEPQVVQQVAEFSDKAAGWVIVAAGGLLLAVRETAALAETLHLWIAVFWVLVVLMPVVCASYTVSRLKRTHDLLDPAGASGAAKTAAAGPV